ncbi:MAG: ArsR/SmtB family transcription factor [Phycisphaerae bacterium]
METATPPFASIKYSNYHLNIKQTKPPSTSPHEHVAFLAHSMTSPQRLRLLTLLAQSAKTVEELADELGESLANTSAHLKVLRGACLVERQKEGRFARYRLASERIEPFLTALQELAHDRLPALREAVRTFDAEEVIELTPGELLAGIRRRRLILLDVRPPGEFSAGHIPGARSMPLATLRREVPRLKGKVLLYCRGPYCAGAKEALAILRTAGADVRRLRAGIIEWRAGGHPVADGAADRKETK